MTPERLTKLAHDAIVTFENYDEVASQVLVEVIIQNAPRALGLTSAGPVDTDGGRRDSSGESEATKIPQSTE